MARNSSSGAELDELQGQRADLEESTGAGLADVTADARQRMRPR